MKYFIKKIISLIITLLVISLLTFTAFSIIPGDAALSKLGVDASPTAVENLRKEYGLDKPVIVRYGDWLADALHGDFGQSFKYSNKSVSELMASRLPVTVLLAVMSLIIIVVVSLPLGMLSARFSGRWPDTVINIVSQVLMAIPSFFLGIIITYVFGIVLRVFQTGGFVSPDKDLQGCIRYLFFPAVAVAIPKIAMVVKYLRNSVLSEMKKDYVRTAYSKGNSDNQVLYGHVFRNALIPVITYVGPMIAGILTGSMVVESIFNIGGLGAKFVSAINNRDYTLIMATTIFLAVIMVIANLITDIVYKFVDPRIKLD